MSEFSFDNTEDTEDTEEQRISSKTIWGEIGKGCEFESHRPNNT